MGNSNRGVTGIGRNFPKLAGQGDGTGGRTGQGDGDEIMRFFADEIEITQLDKTNA